MYKHIVSIAAAGLLAACAAGPDYKTPSSVVPEVFNAAHQQGDFSADEVRFWQGFEDPLLASLIDDTLIANQSLQGALARYQQADALLNGARRDRWPSITASGRIDETEPSRDEFTSGSNGEQITTYQAGINAAWEPDLFGRLQRITESRQAELGAAAADVAALQVALVGELASSYFQLRGLQEQYQVAEKNVQLYEASLDIIGARVNAGSATDFDRVRAQAQLARVYAELPTLEADIYIQMHRIGVLTGQPPSALIEVLSEKQSLPEALPVIPVDSPVTVIRRRPDIAAAERRLAAANARIGVAAADMFPHFTLGGLLGSVALDSSDLFTDSTESRRVTLGVDWTFLDFSKVQARIDAADAASRAALADYQLALLVALEDVENRLVYYDRIQKRTDRLQAAEVQAMRAVELARKRFESGLISYFEVLTAEQEVVTARDLAVRSRTEELVAMADVYRTLAGAPASGESLKVVSAE